MKKWKMSEETKETLWAIGGITAMAAMYIIIGSINPLLIASDGYMEFLDGF